MAARITVFLIVSHRIPDIYLRLGGTHIHHLNYGIFLLSECVLISSWAGRRKGNCAGRRRCMEQASH
jgi:hypothetical protein